MSLPKKGFSLIELLVVIAIIGILASFAAASYSNAQQKSRDGKRKADLKAVQQALEIYYQTNGKYPDTFSGQIRCNVTGDTNIQGWGTRFDCDENGSASPPVVVFYMDPLPKDPSFATSNNYYYESSSPFNSYKISAALENTRDQEYCDPAVTNCIGTGRLPCTPASNKTFCVVNP